MFSSVLLESTQFMKKYLNPSLWSASFSSSAHSVAHYEEITFNLEGWRFQAYSFNYIKGLQISFFFISTKVLLNYCLLKTSIQSFLLKEGKKWGKNSCFSVSFCWTASTTVLLANIWSADHFLYFWVKWMKRDHFTYCKECQVQTHCNCNFFALVIRNFTLCFYTASYMHRHICIHFPPLTSIQIFLFWCFWWQSDPIPSFFSTSSCCAFSYPVPSLHCTIVPTIIQSWSWTNNSYKIKKKQIESTT